MSRSRYRLADLYGGELDESAATIDAAIEQAKARSRMLTHPVTVIDRLELRPVVRGLAEAGHWRWVSPCATCRGTGRLKMASRPEEACGRCLGRGWR